MTVKVTAIAMLANMQDLNGTEETSSIHPQADYPVRSLIFNNIVGGDLMLWQFFLSFVALLYQQVSFRKVWWRRRLSLRRPYCNGL